MLVKEPMINLIFFILLTLTSFYFSLTVPALSAPLTAQNNAFDIYICKAISNTRILPNSYPVPGKKGHDLYITACRGEYEPASFAIQARQPIKGLTLRAGDLHNGRTLIPSDAVDIRVVKVWFQAGYKINDTKHPVLAPELLLKDDDLVQVDLQGQRNFLRTTTPSKETKHVLISGSNSEDLMDVRPQDTADLQPVNIDAGMVKQFWVTTHVPENATPGQYSGTIQLVQPHSPPVAITLHLTVLPFILEKPVLRYGIYYRGKLTPYALDVRANLIKDGRATISAEWKNAQEYAAEMANLKAHGIDYPTFYQPNLQLLRQEIEIRTKAGLPKDTFYSCTLPNTGNPQTPEKLELLKKRVRSLVEFARHSGYQEVYIYGIDEATGNLLKSQRPAWAAVHQVGAKIFVGTYKEAFVSVGDLLDLPIIGGNPDVAQAETYHSIGHKIFARTNPQIGVEEPETYRRNFGLLVWKAKYDGVMNYAYQDGYGNIWNDFDHKIMRDHVFAYPTVNGVIDTVHWEGQREGVDDVRYLTTLLKAIREAGPAKLALAQQAQEWVNRLDPRGDLDKTRSTMIDWILKLQ